MVPKELTRHQLSSRLQYESRTPAFLQRLKNKIQGGADEDEDEDEPQYYDDGSGRPPIPVRPAIPQRPEGDRGSASEDDADEQPQVVVLKEGKHLTAREAENERRKAKGLPLLTIIDDESSKLEHAEQSHKDPPVRKMKEKVTLSFSSSREKSSSTSGKSKRKIITDNNESGDEGERVKKARKKKLKREGKGLLSFAEDV